MNVTNSNLGNLKISIIRIFIHVPSKSFYKSKFSPVFWSPRYIDFFFFLKFDEKFGESILDLSHEFLTKKSVNPKFPRFQNLSNSNFEGGPLKFELARFYCTNFNSFFLSAILGNSKITHYSSYFDQTTESSLGGGGGGLNPKPYLAHQVLRLIFGSFSRAEGLRHGQLSSTWVFAFFLAI